MHGKKMVAPIIVTILVILYYIAYFGVIICVLDRAWAILLGIIPLIFGGVLIYVCYERIKEIKGGEEDDLSQY